jgi:hypothetical protein
VKFDIDHIVASDSEVTELIPFKINSSWGSDEKTRNRTFFHYEDLILNLKECLYLIKIIMLGHHEI